MPEMISTAAQTAARPSRAALFYNLAGIAVLALFLATAAAYLIDELSRDSQPALATLTDGDPVVQNISGHELSIPRVWFRYGEQIRDGFTNQIDLRIAFAPQGATPVPVDVTLLPRSRARTSASLLDRVYLHQFNDDTLGGVSGLVGKPMQQGDGYGGESVWYDALSPTPFVTKCLAAIAPDTPSQCVRTVYLPSGIAAIYTFDAKILQSWREFDPEMQKWLSTIGAW